jgi:hypothetical protein
MAMAAIPLDQQSHSIHNPQSPISKNPQSAMPIRNQRSVDPQSAFTTPQSVVIP